MNYLNKCKLCEKVYVYGDGGIDVNKVCYSCRKKLEEQKRQEDRVAYVDSEDLICSCGNKLLKVNSDLHHGPGDNLDLEVSFICNDCQKVLFSRNKSVYTWHIN